MPSAGCGWLRVEDWRPSEQAGRSLTRPYSDIVDNHRGGNRGGRLGGLKPPPIFMSNICIKDRLNGLFQCPSAFWGRNWRIFWNLFFLYYFFLLIFDIFSLKRPKSEEFSFFRGGLVPETTISPPLNFSWRRPWISPLYSSEIVRPPGVQCTVDSGYLSILSLLHCTVWADME